jgi:hypothetical protein
MIDWDTLPSATRPLPPAKPSKDPRDSTTFVGPGKTNPVDPRPDLPQSDLWMSVLRHAWRIDHATPDGLYQVFDGLRCLGAALDVQPDRLYLKRGGIEVGEWSTVMKRWLIPKRLEIVDVLTKASR